MSSELSDLSNEINIDAPNIYSGNNDELTNSDLLKRLFKTKFGSYMLSFVVIRFIFGLIKKISTDSIFQNAAQMAYYFLFAMLPMTIFIAGIFQLLPIPEDKIIEFVSAIAPEDVSLFLISFFETTMGEPQVVLLSFGFIVAIWSASTGVNAMLFAINDAYGTVQNESFFKRKFKSICIAFGMIFSVAGTLVIFVSGRQISNYLMEKFEVSFQLATSGVILSCVALIILLFIVFVMLYWIGPARKVKISYILPGAVFASVAWVISSLVFSYYADHFANFTSSYGSVAGIMMLMIWFYITGIILTLGGCLNAFIEHTLKMKHDGQRKN